jgi:aryl-alcohol dehydrogenase-like predicted oxidoreductase
MSSNRSHYYRRLGTSDLLVSPVGFGCWPIAGISSLGVNDQDSLATIQAALDSGINFFDTAFSYGYDGEADRLLAHVLAHRRGEIVLASKVGSHYDAERRRVVDGRPEVLITHAKQAAKRLGIEQFDVMYLHEVDPQVPLAESAGALAQIVQQGVARYAGVSNVNLPQLREFHEVCPVIVVQPPYNMLQTESVEAIRDFCDQNRIGLACYWVLMKGLLAGKMKRDHQFDPADRRLTYPIYQGQAWERAQDLLDQLRTHALQLNCTLAQLVIAWTLCQPGITAALCGAKRPAQIAETAQAMNITLDATLVQALSELAAACSPHAKINVG